MRPKIRTVRLFHQSGGQAPPVLYFGLACAQYGHASQTQPDEAGGAMKRSAKPDPLALWRRALDPSLILAYPLVRPVTTLQGVEDRLVAVGNWLGTLHDDRPDEREQGVAVGNLASDFALRLLDHLGLVVNDGPSPPITNLEMGRLAVGNLLAVVRIHLVEIRNFAALQNDDQDLEKLVADAPVPSDGMEIVDAPTPSGGLETTAAPAQSSKLEINPTTFRVSYKGNSCFLGNKTMFHLLVRLNQSPGTPVSYHTLAQDVWGDDLTTDWTIQKQANLLKKKLRADGLEGVEIDGSVKGHYCLILR